MAMYVDRCYITLSLKLKRDSLYIFTSRCVRKHNEENRCPSTKLVSVTF
jgi:hypothetical protein